jgi:hypothetical protein
MTEHLVGRCHHGRPRPTLGYGSMLRLRSGCPDRRSSRGTQTIPDAIFGWRTGSDAHRRSTSRRPRCRGRGPEDGRIASNGGSTGRWSPNVPPRRGTGVRRRASPGNRRDLRVATKTGRRTSAGSRNEVRSFWRRNASGRRRDRWSHRTEEVRLRTPSTIRYMLQSILPGNDRRGWHAERRGRLRGRENL